MKRSLILTALLLGLGLLAVAGCVFSRLGYETPGYKTERSDGKFEIRRYGELTVVSVPMKTGTVDGANGSFMRLFRYLSKDNASAEKISMTTPVLMSKDEADPRMSFVMPAETVAKGVPAPKGADMRIDKQAAGRYAVHRFSGSLEEAAARKAEKLLREWAGAQQLKTVGPVIVAGYDPPFTPPAMRRNEILLRLAD